VVLLQVKLEREELEEELKRVVAVVEVEMDRCCWEVLQPAVAVAVAVVIMEAVREQML
jgi:hypothetical protein